MRLEDGTAIGSGMATAANMLKDSTAESKLVTLITDGVNNAGELDPYNGCHSSRRTVGIKLYTIGVGRGRGGWRPAVRLVWCWGRNAGEPAR